MLRTVSIGSSISVQGIFVAALPGGKISVRVGETVFSGRPVGNAA